MKTNAIVRIVLFSIAILVLLGILLAGLAAGLFSFISREVDSEMDMNPIVGGNLASSSIVDAATIKEIEIEWVSGSITIEPGDTNSIEFAESEVSKDKYKMVWKQSGDKLVIRFCENENNWIGINTDMDISKDLLITVPKDWVCDELDINSVSASIDITDLTAKEVDLDNVSGICTLENCTVEDISLDTVSGDIRFSGSFSVMDCDAVSANCSAEVTTNPKRITMDGVSGDLDLTLPEGCGFTAKLDTASGDISYDFPTTSSGDQYTHGDGSCRITISGVSGDIIIRKGQ